MTDAFTIRVPASTANLGAGFDSIGMAIDRYLVLHVKKSDRWFFELTTEELRSLPTDEENFIFQVAKWVADRYERTLPAVTVTVESDIPLARGFGSSASAIVAAIELANQLLELSLTDDEKCRLASIHEGHPDNVSPSIYGGLTIGSHREEETDIVRIPSPPIELVAVIPRYELSTSTSRGTLPTEMSYGQAVEASSVSNVLVAAIIQNDWTLAGKMMSKDLFHKPYRQPVIKEWELAETLIADLPVYGATLSGAGPIILFFVPEGEGEKVRTELETHYTEHEVTLVSVPNEGVTVTREV